MPEYKNVSRAPWRRPLGELVPPGGTFSATPREHARIQRRPSYKKCVELVAGTEPPPKEEGTEWPCKMSPEQYLKLHADGKHAPLALKLVEAASVNQ
jgi:hypothetical protein